MGRCDVGRWLLLRCKFREKRWDGVSDAQVRHWAAARDGLQVERASAE